MCKHGKVKTSLNNRFAMCNTYKIVTMNLTFYYFKPINPNLLNGTNNSQSQASNGKYAVAPLGYKSQLAPYSTSTRSC